MVEASETFNIISIYYTCKLSWPQVTAVRVGS